MNRVISARSTSSGGGSHSSVGILARHDASRAAHGDRHPLRDPAARGWVAAGARRGRRRRAVRGQVPRRRAGPEGAGRRDRGGRAGPRRSGCRSPSWCSSSSIPSSARAEPDPEIQDLIKASAGLNLGVDFLPGALPYTPARPARARARRGRRLARRAVENIDRTPRNPNLLLWHGNLWLIDHGAALYVHHGGGDPLAVARRPFPAIRDHVLLGRRGPAAGCRRAARAAGRPGGGRRARAARVGRRGGLRRAPRAPARGAARVAGGGRACPRVRTSSTRSSASCRTWSAASP